MENRKPPLSPACFRLKTGKVDWRLVQTAKWDEWIRSANFEQVNELMRNLISARLDEEEVAFFRGAALHRLLELMQKSAQLLTYKRLKEAPASPDLAESAPEAFPCSLCYKRFESQEYLEKHVARRHCGKTAPRRNSEAHMLQEAATFLQNEVERLRNTSEKQLDDTINSLQYLIEKTDTIVQKHRQEKRLVREDGQSSLKLISELARTQKELLEYETALIRARLPQKPPPEPTVVVPSVVILSEDVSRPQKPPTSESRLEKKTTETDNLEIELELTESSENLKELVAAAKLIGFDFYEKPEYSYLAEELLACPVPAPWGKVDNGVMVMYRNSKTTETVLFHPKLESFQLRFRHCERVKSIGRELRNQLKDPIPKFRSFEEKYRGRLLHFFQHSQPELQAKRTELANKKNFGLIRHSQGFDEVKELLKQQLDTFFVIVKSDSKRESASLQESAPTPQPRARPTSQESGLPPKPPKAVALIKPLVSSIVTLQTEKECGPFSRFFMEKPDDLKRRGTLIGENEEGHAWEPKSLRTSATIYGLLSTSEKDLVIPSDGKFAFVESPTLVALSSRSNGISPNYFLAFWYPTIKTETFDIEMVSDEPAEVLLSKFRFKRE